MLLPSACIGNGEIGELMSQDPWGAGTDLFSGEVASGDSRRRLHSPAVLLGIAAAALTLVGLTASLSGSEGHVAVAAAAAGYLLAVLSDVLARRAGYRAKKYRRPPLPVALRVAAFALAVWVAWMAASTLAGAP
ncbi:MAG: hypothetical protein OXF00_00235 [bacterium]|nr:hypothetical protein [bacterium]